MPNSYAMNKRLPLGIIEWGVLNALSSVATKAPASLWPLMETPGVGAKPALKISRGAAGC